MAWRPTGRGSGAFSARRPGAVAARPWLRDIVRNVANRRCRRATLRRRLEQTLIASSSDIAYLAAQRRPLGGAFLTPALTRQCGCDTERHFCEIDVFLFMPRFEQIRRWLWIFQAALCVDCS